MSEDRRMDSSQPDCLLLTGTSKISLNERFSQVLLEQLTRSRMGPCDPVHRRVSGPPLVLLGNNDPSSLPHLQLETDGSQTVKRHLRRQSIWTRLGGQQVAHRFSTFTAPGFWSFRNKYRWMSRVCSRCKRRGNLNRGVGRRRLLKTAEVHKLTATGRTQTSLQLRTNKKDVPTRQQLDAQLDEYMSMSRRRLDNQLDEYMCMAGQTLIWDGDGKVKTED
ncbi:uncharacterized protein LOC129349629 [Amphiprion ocellaris]|uniref:uncharacterized protein LOC129349629 n=1 Tax=Amphiprion ocellaris TaxID=80972 RepID=UPI0024111F02|nr:uncharacterized protein LOC129349629 [Amphiprion ocellaris]